MIETSKREKPQRCEDKSNYREIDSRNYSDREISSHFCAIFFSFLSFLRQNWLASRSFKYLSDKIALCDDVDTFRQ